MFSEDLYKDDEIQSWQPRANDNNNYFEQSEVQDMIVDDEINNMSVDEESAQIGGALFTVTNTSERRSEHWGWTERMVSVAIPQLQPTSFKDGLEKIQRLFSEIFSQFIEPIADKNRIEIVFQHNEFRSDVEIGHIEKSKLTVEMLMYNLETSANRTNKFSTKISQGRIHFGF